VAIILRHAKVTDADRVTLMGIACIAAAIGTVLQALPRGPVGSGFLAPPMYSATYLAPSVLAAEVGGIPLVFGMTLFAGLVEISIGLAINRLRIVITPILSGLAVFIVGLQLGIVGIGETLDVTHVSLPSFPLHLATTTLTLGVCVALSIWGRGVFKLLCTTLGLAAGLAAAAAIGLIDVEKLQTLKQTAWLAPPWPTFMNCRFDVGLAPAFLAAGVAAGLRAVGVITTCQRLNNAAWRRPDMRNIRKGVLADGLANVVGGMIGAPGMSVAPSLVGISGATGATSRAIAFASAVVLAAIGCSPKTAGFFLMVPTEVAGSLLVFTSCFMIAGGMSIMLSRPIDTRANYIIGISTLLALSENLFPAYFHHLSPAARTIAATPLALSLTAALVLTLLFRLGTRRVAEIGWEGADDSIAAALVFLRARQADWKIVAQTAETSITEAKEVLDYIAAAHKGPFAGRLRAVHNGLELRVDIRYAGNVIPRPPERPSTPPQTVVDDDLDNEEAAAFVGLRAFIRSLTADRKEVVRRGGEVIVRLSYAI
jgi:NCS2 family nucleobase:cation symporter-2